MKLVLKSKKVISAQTLASSSTTYLPLMSQADVISLQSVYTGSPVGTLDVQISLNYNPVDGSGDWTSLPITQTLPGAASPILMDISGGNYNAMRIVYTRSSGSGSMDVYLAYKRIGD